MTSWDPPVRTRSYYWSGDRRMGGGFAGVNLARAKLSKRCTSERAFQPGAEVDHDDCLAGPSDLERERTASSGEQQAAAHAGAFRVVGQGGRRQERIVLHRLHRNLAGKRDPVP